MQSMYAQQMMMSGGLGSLGMLGAGMSPYGAGLGFGGFGHGGFGLGHHHHPLMSGGFGLGHPIQHAHRVRTAATAAAMSGGNPAVAAAVASNPAIAMSSQLMGGVFQH